MSRGKYNIFTPVCVALNLPVFFLLFEKIFYKNKYLNNYL